MENENGQEKTEKPSSKRLKESRDKGQVVRSKDFNALINLLFVGFGFLLFGESAIKELALMMRQATEFQGTLFSNNTYIFNKAYTLFIHGIWALVPFLVMVLFLAFIGPLILGGWICSAKNLQPKVSRMDPLKGFKRMVSLKGFMEMFKSFLKFLVIAGFTLMVLKYQVPELMHLSKAPLEVASSKGMYIILNSFLVITSSLIIIALIDVPFQIYEHQKQLKMTKQELIEEHKELEGRPEVKSHIRKIQFEIAQRRMMSEIPSAQVVLMNPTHYAVAIRYDESGNKPPIVVAKGKDLMAMNIKKIAKAHNIPTMTLPPLTRALYFSTKLNAEIPRGLYVAVAQVLAYIFQLEDKLNYDVSPSLLQKVPIPKEFIHEENA